VRSTAAALALGHEMGGLRAEIVDSVAAAVRQRLDTRAEARGLATQARASAVVLAAGPVAFLVLGLLRKSAATQFLLGSPAGLVCLLGGLLLDAAGLFAMLRLVSGVGR
jgi:tight adherence protein B